MTARVSGGHLYRGYERPRQAVSISYAVLRIFGAMARNAG